MQATNDVKTPATTSVNGKVAKVCLVTGASSGIGYVTALELLQAVTQTPKYVPKGVGVSG